MYEMEVGCFIRLVSNYGRILSLVCEAESINLSGISALFLTTGGYSVWSVTLRVSA